MTRPGAMDLSIAGMLGIGTSLVIGADGLIGHALLMDMTFHGLPAVGSTRSKPSRSHSRLMIDLAQPAESWPLPASIGVAYLCAGVASIEQCRQFPRLTEKVNCHGSIALAQRLASQGTMVVYLSSNLVFAGQSSHSQADASPHPQTEYGRQKAYTEQAILGLGRLGAVIRLTKVLPPNAPLFEGWRKTLLAGQPITPFADMRLAPVGLDLVVEALQRVGRQRRHGITQISASHDITYEQAARHIARRLKVSESLIQPISARSAGLPVESTPAHTTMDTTSLAALGLSAPNPWETLDHALGFRPQSVSQGSHKP